MSDELCDVLGEPLKDGDAVVLRDPVALGVSVVDAVCVALALSDWLWLAVADWVREGVSLCVSDAVCDTEGVPDCVSLAVSVCVSDAVCVCD